MKLTKTKYLSDKKLKDEFAVIKNKTFTIIKSELHEDFRAPRNRYEKVFCSESPLIKLNNNYNEDFKDKIAIVVSINECLDPPYVGQRSYDVLIGKEQFTIMGYNIEKVMNGI